MAGRRIGGTVVPFHRKDKYNTWWDGDSQFNLDLFPTKPVFLAHNLREIGLAGTIDNAAFAIRGDGLYAEADVNEGRLGDAVLALVSSGSGAWSSGTMPHLIRTDTNTGYVSQWPIVECSVCHVDEAGSWPGTTTVQHVRKFLDEQQAVEIRSAAYLDQQLKRSQWVMEQSNGNNTQAPANNGQQQQAPAQQDQVQQTLGHLSTALANMANRFDNLDHNIRALQDQPAQQLPVSPPPAQQPVIEVSSKYDDVSLFGMLFRSEHQRLAAAKQGRAYRYDEEFMRAIVDKMQDGELSRVDGGIRAIDADARATWENKLPHLRANEAMQSTLANSGDELVPTLLSSVAYYEFRLQSRVLGLLPTFQMPSQPYDYPTIASGPKFRLASEATDKTQANIGTSRLTTGKPTTDAVQFSAGEIGVLSLVSQTLMEDSGLMVADVLAQQFARNAARDIDYVLLNGDERTAATNISHTADPSSTAYDLVLALDGLRRIAQAASDNVGVGTIATGSITALQAAMGNRGIIGTDIQNLVCVVDPGFYYKLLGLSDFQTMEKVGERATLLTGQVGGWYGIPVVVSDELEYTAATGLVPEAHNGTKGQCVLFHRGLNMVGYRRNLQYEQGTVPHTGLYAMSATVRLDLQAMEAGSVAWGYNATV